MPAARRRHCKPALRSHAERNALALQYRHLPGWTFRQFLGIPCVRRMGYEEAVSCLWEVLLRAAELWDPTRGYTFSTYATHCLCYRLLSAARSWNVIHIPAYADKAPKTRRPARKARHIVGLPGTNNPVGSRRAGDDLADYRHTPDPADLEAARALLASLPPRERAVVLLRYWHDLQLHEIGKRIGVTRERARQLLAQAMRRMREGGGAA